MKRPEDLARRFLTLADRDIKAFRKLSDDPEIDDEVVGFHAQQAVEKCLKAVLAKHRVEQRKTHDLQRLLDLLAKNNLPSPPLCEGIDALVRLRSSCDTISLRLNRWIASRRTQSSRLFVVGQSSRSHRIDFEPHLTILGDCGGEIVRKARRKRLRRRSGPIRDRY